MIERILTVGGFTLLSRITGFARDIMLAAILGAGPVADAFFVAFRLPNHFRAIFAEGAFNASFVPSYARVREQKGAPAAGEFADHIFTLLLASQIILLALALILTPQAIDLLAPGFAHDGERFTLATELTRITFPYLLMITLVTLYSGILNALHKFAAAAAAPILLNLAMMATLALAAYFPTPGHAAAWGVLFAGVLQMLAVGFAVWRRGVLPSFRKPALDADVRQFFRALGPATVGSAGVQLAMFADTIIASFLPAGALSALYYAERLYQLPIGVIGIAVGTVVLPEMARRLAAGDESGAHHAQNRAMELTLLLAAPCVVAFLVVPDLLMRALFTRGAFTSADAVAAGQTLAAYTIGIIPIVLIRSATATFFARGDTATPVKAALIAVAVNIGFKILLMGPLAQVGLALATSIGAWINLCLVLWFGHRRDLINFDPRLVRSAGRIVLAAAILAAVLFGGHALIGAGIMRDEFRVIVLAVLGGLVYFGMLALLLGREWLAPLKRMSRRGRDLASTD